MSLFDPFDGRALPGIRSAEHQAAIDANTATLKRDSAKLLSSIRLRDVQTLRASMAQQLATAGVGNPGLSYGLKRDIARLDAESQELAQTLADCRSAEAQELRARADAIERGA